MDARRLLETVRDQRPISPDAMTWFANGLASGEVSDAQAGAFAMAVLLNGLSHDDRVALMRAMRDSGSVLEWDLPGPVLDKHSTGGVGDCVSLILAPALAVCGAYVPMISGRGLGHTGGTLDKLEAIPGLQTELSSDRLRDQTKRLGCAIVAASTEYAPADRRLYAIRDVTATVESIDLITASILSKKLAEGLEALVLDVKTGSGAFMEDPNDSKELANALVSTAQGAGCMTTALITDMNQPLAPSAGNALEVLSVMEVLTNTKKHDRLWQVTCALGGELLALGGLAADAEDGAGRIANAIETGQAAERFGEMVADQGGPVDFVEHWADRLPAAPVIVEMTAESTGYIGAIDTHALGMGVIDLGGGRNVQGDRIDPAVGLSDIVELGTSIMPGDPLLRIHAASADEAMRVAMDLQGAFVVADRPIDVPEIIQGRVG
ncbi:thymidine phosphorylase [Actibacterium pelagium]|uniref:Thymidine phosphorylase n=1 Tax=Actibacterium pelagium TaxID=2029103 RepID=A0A917AC44_9RHOB|nr:thymidine phosphorylase [Actibacterium pelagium]GGE39346.1 thymidine phosphorylase [Actibacterium pelagium]